MIDLVGKHYTNAAKQIHISFMAFSLIFLLVNIFKSFTSLGVETTVKIKASQRFDVIDI